MSLKLWYLDGRKGIGPCHWYGVVLGEETGALSCFDGSNHFASKNVAEGGQSKRRVAWPKCITVTWATNFRICTSVHGDVQSFESESDVLHVWAIEGRQSNEAAEFVTRRNVPLQWAYINREA